MSLAVQAPARLDLSFRTNSDERFGAIWLESDHETPVAVTAAVVTFRFDPVPPPDYPIPEHPIVVEPDVHRIDSTTPDDPGGWFDATLFPDGTALVTVPHTIWAAHQTRRGDWDLVAVGAGLQRCLLGGVFSVEDGVST